MNKLVKLGKLVQLVKSGMKAFTPYALGIIVIGLTIAGLMGKFAPKTEAAWYDDTFVYRRAIRFGNTGATVTDQKVLIQINTSSTSGLIQDERMQTDCDDTRFTDANGRPLQYFINVSGGAGVGCNDTSTDYYVLMPRIEGGGDTLIYMYYGNYNAVSASAGANFSQSTFSPTSGPSIAAEEAGTAPILYWNFDEGYGTTANDLTIQRNNGTITGSWATDDLCVSGKCLQFNGSSHKVIKTYASDFELDVSSNSFTVSLWMRHASALAGTDTLVSRVSSGGYKIAASSGSFCFAIDDDAAAFDPDDSACTTSTYNDSLWHYVSAVKNGTTSITLYVDGNQVAQDSSLTGTGSLSGSSPEFDVGVDGSSNFFDGAIDEVKVYNTAKTVSQIKAEYSSRSATGEGSSTVAGGNTIPWMSNGLVGYWRMDEPGMNDCDGTNDTCDVSGNVNHGAWTNNAIVTGGGKFGRGVWFDGTTDYVSVADSTSLSVTTQVSLSLWINSSSSVTSEAILVKNNSYRLVTDANSNPVCQVSDGSTWQTAATSGTALTTSTWYHVGCSYDGQTIRVFVNGVETGRNALVSSIGDNANALEFGRDAGATYTDFGGVLDSIRIYNRALSPAEVQQLYNFAPGPVVEWKMEEKTGTTVNDTSGNAAAGAFSTIGADTNDLTWTTGKIGTGLNFIGTDDYVQYNVGDWTGAFSVSFWAKAANTSLSEGTGIFSSTGNANVNGSFQIDIGGGTDGCTGMYRLKGRNDAGSVFTVCFTTYTTDWTHLIAAWDGITLKTYTNGVFNNSSTPTVTAQMQLYKIGTNRNNSSGLFFNGTIDHLRVYNYARTPKQIIEDMNAGHPAPGSPIGSQTIYWKFDEQQGSTANNAVNPAGSGEWDGTITGADWRVPENNCKINGCLTFSTATDDVSAGDASFTDSLTAMTVSLWVSPTTLATSKGIVSKSNFGAGSSFAITTGSTNTEIRVFVASSTSSDENYFTTTDFSLTTSTFAHLAMVYDGALPASERVKVYKDGRRAAGSVTGTIPTSMVASSTANLTAGESGSTSYQALDAHMDEVKIYNFALTASEVLVDMNAGSAAAMGGVLGTHDSEGFSGNLPVGDWKLDDNTGTTAADTSGNDNSLTLTNGPTWTTGKYGAAINFDGSNDYLTRADDADFDFGAAASFTTEAWIKHAVQSGSAGTIVHEEVDTGTIESATATITSVVTSTNSTAVTNDLYVAAVSTKPKKSIDSVTGLGLTWTLITSQCGDRNQTNTAIFYAIGTPSGDGTVTANLNGGTAYSGGAVIAVHRYSGIDTSSPIGNTEVANTAGAGASAGVCDATGTDASTYSFSTLDTTQANSVVFSAVGQRNNTHTAGTNYTERADIKSGTGGDTAGMATQDQTFASTTTNLTVDGTLSGTSDWSVVAVEIKAATGTTPVILAKYNATTGTDGGYKMLMETDGDITCGIDDDQTSFPEDSATSTAATYDDSAWHFVTCVKNANTSVDLYIDGALIASDTTIAATGTLANTDALYVGIDGDGTSSPWQGPIDQVKIYNYARSQAQVAYDYNRGAPVGWWKFDECQGNTAFDSSLKPGYSSIDLSGAKPGNISFGSSGNTATGTCGSGTGTEMWNNGTTGKMNASLDFDGTDDRVVISDTGKLDITGAFTLSAWVNKDADVGAQIISKTNAGTSGGYALLTGSVGEVYCRTNNGTTSVDSFSSTVNPIVTAGTGWHHVAVARSGTSCRVYIDGKDMTASAGSHADPAANALDLTIGTRPNAGGEFWNGRIDDARMYNYQMTAAQMLRLYNEGSAVRFGPQSGSP